MKSTISLVLACVVVSTCCFGTAEANADNAQILENYGKIPLAFTMNQGQVDSQVKFTSQGSGCTMFFTPQGTTFLLSKETEASVAKRLAKRSVVYQGDPHADREPEIDREYFALKLNFLNANSSPEIAGEDRLSWNNNYFLGNDPSKWRTDVPNYEKIRLRNVYDGIDLVYYGNRNKIKYDFVVKAGEDPSHILLKYDFGTSTQGSLSINTADELVVSTPLGELIEQKPYCYQVIDGKKTEVEGQYIILDTAEHTFSFAVEGFNPAYDLVIDPTLVYSTYLGGSSIDGNRGIAVDGSGSAYVTGYTMSTDFPTVNPYQSDQGGYDVFVTKLTPTGNDLVYSTYLGGSSIDDGSGIAVDGSGSAYVTGTTGSTDFPTVNPYQSDQGSYDAFVTKLTPTGNDLVYSTYLGGSSSDDGSGIAVDGSGSAYVTGYTYSTDFPTVNPYQSDQGYCDAFVTKFSPTGKTLEYSTYLGGSDYEWGTGIAVDGSGSAYVTGYTGSTDFPTVNPYQSNHGGISDAFVTKLTPSGNDLVYSTYLGGSSSDIGYGIAVDGSGSAYVTGLTASTDFPTVNPYQSYQGDVDVFVTKLNPSGNDLEYSTYLGGGDSDHGFGIAVDGSGSAYVTGDTYSTDFPTENPYQTDQGGLDAFVTKFTSDGNALIYSTYLGGGDIDYGYDIAVDGYSVYVTGETNSTDFPTGNPYQTDQGGTDAFVTKFFELQYILGDCNNNGRIDIGDAVILINYLLELGPPPDPIGRGDCNHNGRIDIGDVVMIINHLLFGTPIESQMIAQNDSKEDIQKSSVDSPETVAQVTLSRVDQKITLDVETETEIGGFFVSIGYENGNIAIGTPTLALRCEDMKLEYNMTDSGMNIVIYSMEGKRIKPGIGSLLSIPIQPKEGINHIDAVGLTIDDISLSDIEGRLIPVEGLNISTSIDSYDREALLDMEFKLEQNYPNPFNPVTTIEYGIPYDLSGNISLRIYDLRGALVKTLVNNACSPGIYSVVWDGTDETGNIVSSGLYIYQLQVGEFTKSNKMMLMR